MTDDLEKIVEWLMNTFTPRCPYCDTELDKYAFYDYRGAFRLCPKCKKVVRE